VDPPHERGAPVVHLERAAMSPDSTGSGPLLVGTGLTLRVGSRTLAEGLTLRIGSGELWCVIGANGSGKTTLLHTLAGLRRPDAGTLALQGRELAEWPLHEAARLRGLLPQSLHDAFSASALDVALMGRHPHLARWAWESAGDRALALAALRAVDMDAFATRDVLTLSGGERQRVGIAALLAQDPAMLLLDEPLAHLDMHHQLVVLQHLRALAREQGKAVLLTIHDLNLARRFATHALVLGANVGPCSGRVHDVMTEATIGSAFGHPVTTLRSGEHTLFVPA
jgi:iron complex transport system ATP-binding protein